MSNEAIATQRHVLIHDGQIVVDNETGLWWPVNDSDEWFTPDEAAKFCEDFRLGDYNDWFQPNLQQLESIRSTDHYEPALFPLFKSNGGWVWTSTQTPWTKDEKGSARSFFFVGMGSGYVGNDYASSRFRVRPCRVGGPVPAGQ
ncbi:DUF1566 domain-containing protein [Luteibacter yeojuensis]|uniref:DUF1566 domain-containing protein n=1 Tax=Luteibacter yeojuensis TaxID=345309 RepID=A0A7X5TPR6_9GAMM|nr:DUF1566 domain-containing protein [Luteibacter yeojuensis]NID15004.1 DUF1566 domain-containing protein [Luteibacter yeojuensis]